MFVFDEILEKCNEITFGLAAVYEKDREEAFNALETWFEEYKSKGSGSQKSKNANAILQSIKEDEDEPCKPNEAKSKRSSKIKPLVANNTERDLDHDEAEKPLDHNDVPDVAKLCSKNCDRDDVDGFCSPEKVQRPKRNASVRAQGVISKQMTMNLSSKLRREPSLGKEEGRTRRRGQTETGSDKENNEPLIKVKEEKISLPPEEPIECVNADIEVKQEVNTDSICMPPPAAPLPKSRGRAGKTKGSEGDSSDRRGLTGSQKQTDPTPAPSVRSSRSNRANSRTNSKASEGQQEDMPPPPPPAEGRSKRTRAKRKADAETSQAEPEKVIPQEDAASPIKEPRPKRTRRGKAAQSEKEEPQKAKATTEIEMLSPKEERVSVLSTGTVSSPMVNANVNLSQKDTWSSSKIQGNIVKAVGETTQAEPEKVIPQDDTVSLTKEPRPKRTRRGKAAQIEKEEPQKAKATERTEALTTGTDSSPILTANVNLSNKDTQSRSKIQDETTGAEATVKPANLEETRIISTCMDQTVVLTNEDCTKAAAMNETFVLAMPSSKSTVGNAEHHIHDATVVIEKYDPKPPNMTNDDSLMTDDSSGGVTSTTPHQRHTPAQPLSAVKEKVQQFEEMASRVTRTKTRAMAKKDDQTPEEAKAPAEKVSKAVLSGGMLAEMQNMIFGYTAPRVAGTVSTSKPRANVVVTSTKSISKLSALAKAKEAAEEILRKDREKENAKQKKEAILEAKKEAQRRKREEKMAAAAAAREAAERERQLAIEAAAKERMEKQAHVDMGKIERAKEHERKKLELMRKAAITEERRLAEERARHQRLAEEQKRAELARKKQQEEQEATKKEAAQMVKEMEKRRKEYFEKQKLKQKTDAEKEPNAKSTTPAMEPVYMVDGFEQLNSDSEIEDGPRHPVPAWSTSKARVQQLREQGEIDQFRIDELFSVRHHTPDLTEIFPNISKHQLKRTSSAVWRTPPCKMQKPY